MVPGPLSACICRSWFGNGTTRLGALKGAWLELCHAPYVSLASASKSAVRPDLDANGTLPHLIVELVCLAQGGSSRCQRVALGTTAELTASRLRDIGRLFGADQKR